jgi:hypothetical protein
MEVRLSALRAGRPLPAGRFLELVSVRGRVDPRAIVRLEGSCQLKNHNDLIGNRTRDIPACSAVPQPITLKISQVYITPTDVSEGSIVASIFIVK